jgi:hypothetical protein
MTRRRKDPLRALTDGERARLGELGRGGSAPSALVTRARAYTYTEVVVRTQDEAGPYRAIPRPGSHWRPASSPARDPHEHIRHGTAKLLTLFHPAAGQVRVTGVTSTDNTVLHPWPEAEMTAILATLPEPPIQAETERRAAWERWQDGLAITFALPDRLPPWRMLSRSGPAPRADRNTEQRPVLATSHRVSRGWVLGFGSWAIRALGEAPPGPKTQHSRQGSMSICFATQLTVETPFQVPSIQVIDPSPVRIFARYGTSSVPLVTEATRWMLPLGGTFTALLCA